MPNENLDALIERVRGATGPDRELDEAICLACFPTLRPAIVFCAGDPPIFMDEPFRKEEPPLLTSSLDAAVALAERCLPGWQWNISSFAEDAVASMGSLANGVVHQAKTPALALVLAILTAIKAQDGRRG